MHTVKTLGFVGTQAGHFHGYNVKTRTVDNKKNFTQMPTFYGIGFYHSKGSVGSHFL